jgi:iduronate 2-sulfatase
MKSKLLSVFILLFSILFSCKTSNITPKQTEKKPINVLFIAVDDLKPMTGAYGVDFMQTPHLDNLAAEGFIFTNNHCQQAVCGPTRASLLTGKRPDYTQVYDLKTQMRDINPDILTLPQHFKQNGYKTAAVGKIFDPRCVDNTYDSISWSYPYIKTKNKEYANATQKVSYESNERPESESIDGEIAANGIQYLQQFAQSNEPFFLAVGFKKPHLPFVAPKKYWDMYPIEKVNLPSYRLDPEGAPSFATQPSWELRSGYDDIPKDFNTPISDEQQRKLIQGYYASVSFIDAQIGKVIEELKRLGLRDNTIIVLWGDHGWHLGDHNMFCKHTNYEQATRSPLFISYPGNLKGKINSPTEFVDIFPTICDLAGLQIPQNLDGLSLKPLMEKKVAKIKDYAVSQFPRDNDKMGYAFRNDRYRYIIWLKDFTSNQKFDASMIIAEELYDYQTAPDESKNLILNPEYLALKNELKAQAIAFFKQHEVQ